ncbi:hypothetical protein BDP27DRAFT_1367676 [Rhodocollybia butyracea]|uniref:Alcohol dehydrogenase-like C-terminal domain-containing protein n=1 Tax=Rhodocollybia butyracea TaxID=206335 RepID=A0A9P5PIB5_9AGAR|nr:hypothetical protein BDP27DRAFT_1367676 [Rhodocollybia butyracea]
MSAPLLESYCHLSEDHGGTIALPRDTPVVRDFDKPILEVANALATLCVHDPQSDVYAVALRLTGDSLKIYVAENNGVPEKTKNHLEKLLSKLSQIATASQSALENTPPLEDATTESQKNDFGAIVLKHSFPKFLHSLTKRGTPWTKRVARIKEDLGDGTIRRKCSRRSSSATPLITEMLKMIDPGDEDALTRLAELEDDTDINADGTLRRGFSMTRFIYRLLAIEIHTRRLLRLAVSPSFVKIFTNPVEIECCPLRERSITIYPHNSLKLGTPGLVSSFETTKEVKVSLHAELNVFQRLLEAALVKKEQPTGDWYLELMRFLPSFNDIRCTALLLSRSKAVMANYLLRGQHQIYHSLSKKFIRALFVGMQSTVVYLIKFKEDIKYLLLSTIPTDIHPEYNHVEGDPTMKALAWFGAGDVRVNRCAYPRYNEPDDVILQVTGTTICVRIYIYTMARLMALQKGDILGQSSWEKYLKSGPTSRTSNPGQRVVSSFQIACGKCEYCKQNLSSFCDRTNSSCVFRLLPLHRWLPRRPSRIRPRPNRRSQPPPDPDSVPDEKAIYLSDVLPTSYHTVVDTGVKVGDVVGIWGLGPIGQCAARWALLKGASRVIPVQRYSEADLRNLPRGLDVALDCGTFHEPKSLVHKVQKTLMLETDVPETINEMIVSVRKMGSRGIIAAYAGYANGVNVGALMEKGVRLIGNGQAPVLKYWKEILQDYIIPGKLPYIVFVETQFSAPSKSGLSEN